MKARTVLALLVTATLVVAASPGLVADGDAAADAATRTFGTSPRDDVLYWADQRKCEDLSRDALAAMMLVPTYTETGAAGANAPGPMTLSRWDTQAALYAFGTKGLADKAFFHPGIGMWQFDSAGFWPLTAATAINSFTSAEQAASVMATRYCASTQTDPVKKRQYAWAPWYYCTSGTLCEGVYQSLLAGGALDVNTTPVSSTGGMVMRTCEVEGIGGVSCGYVDPAKAEGYANWRLPGFGPAPVTAPFYVFEAKGREYRYWLKEDTGYAQTIRADKPVTANARTSLVWSHSETLCDKTAQRGKCTETPFTPPTSAGFATKGSPAFGRNADGRLEHFAVATSGRLWHRWQLTPGGAYSAWQDMGGSFPPDATPAVGTSPDGRMEVFLVGTNQRIQHIHQQSLNGSWSSWADRGGVLASRQLAVGVNADGRLEVFGRGTGGDLVHTWQIAPNSTWAGAASITGFHQIAPGTEPAVGTTSDGRQKVVFVNPSGYVRTTDQWAANSDWTALATMGGPFPTTTSPAVGRNADGRLEVFVQGPFALVLNSWQYQPGKAGFSAFGIVAGYFTSSPTVVLDKAGKQNVFAANWFGGIVTQVRQVAPNSPWGAPGNVAGATNRRVAAGVNDDGRVEVLYVDAGDQMMSSVHVSAPG